LALIRATKKHDRKIVIEFDDDPFRVDPTNPAYKYYGLKELDAVLSDGKKHAIWRDGENDFHIDRNKVRLETMAVIIQNADLVTVTTKELGKAFKELNDNIYVLPNYVDMKRWNIEIPEVLSDDIRIAWQGGSSHYKDFMVMKDAIKQILKENKNVKLYLYGQGYEALAKSLPKDQLVMDSEWVHFLAHHYRMKLSGADIAIAPISDSEFNRRKSCIKWVEFGAMGVPMVASKIPPYSPVIDHGKTGLLAANDKDWYNQLNKLIKDKKLRKEIGRNVKEEIKANWTTDNYDKHWGEIVKRLYD
jgi:glycosyltransferase involved in cell wall biosynthesis